MMLILNNELSQLLTPGHPSVETAMPSTHAVILSLQSLSKCVWERCVFGETSTVHGQNTQAWQKNPKRDKKKTKDSYPCKCVGASLQGEVSTPVIWVDSASPVCQLLSCPELQAGHSAHTVCTGVPLVLWSTAPLYTVPWGPPSGQRGSLLGQDL